MELEFALDGVETMEAYPVRVSKPLVLDWAPTLASLLRDLQSGTSAGLMSARFHNGLADSIVAVAKQLGQQRVVLSGGCFQNRYLTECAVRRLETEGFRAYWHQRVPPNDGASRWGRSLLPGVNLGEKGAGGADTQLPPAPHYSMKVRSACLHLADISIPVNTERGRVDRGKPLIPLECQLTGGSLQRLCMESHFGLFPLRVS